MATLTVHAEGRTTRMEVAVGASVRELLDATELRVRAACGGTGSCGACGVRLLTGEANGLTVAEYLKLTPAERGLGMRLACQLRFKGDGEIEVEHPAPHSAWRSIPLEDLTPDGAGLTDLEEHVYGVAVDLGTTHIRVALWDRKGGRRIATRLGPNPQAAFGADVLNRLGAVRAGPERGRQLAKLARVAVVQAVRDILARDIGEVTPMLAEIGRVVVVGNTAMLALLTGRGGEDLLAPENWQRAIDCAPVDPLAWRAEWFMPNAEIFVAPPLAGFVGSDLPADLLAMRLIEGPAGSLLLDVGTNTEIALWDGRRLHVASVPGGPAFEGGGVRRGMPAEAGAIWRVRGRDDGGFDCDVVGGGEPRGFCGSGLVDAIAVLLAAGRLKPSGRFAAPTGPEGFPLQAGNANTAIAGSDVDAFQRAKAAMAAATAVLLRRAGISWSELRRVCVCGAFGRTLNIGHARQLGLLPPVDPALVELHGDAALAGCERVLLSKNGPEMLDRAAANPIAVNMSLAGEYDDLYIAHLRLRSMPTE